MGFAVAWDKPGGFIGKRSLGKTARPASSNRNALSASRSKTIPAQRPMIYHEEPIYRDGMIVGSTTSGAWGHRVNLSLGLGYVKNPEA